MSQSQQPNRHICVLAVGTRGDVQPLQIVAACLANAVASSVVTFVTHSAHQEWLPNLEGLQMRWLSPPPALIWDSARAAATGSDHDRAALRDELLHCCLAALGQSTDNAPLAPDAEAVADLKRQRNTALQHDCIIFNLFALEGFHIAEALGCRCLAASPCVVPYSPPASYARRFQAAFPKLYSCLKNSQAGQVGWADLEHWMWPLFTDRWHSWRQLALGLTPVPLEAAAQRGEALPPATPLLYGLPLLIVPRPSYWPTAVMLCGYWADGGPKECALDAPADTFLQGGSVVCIDLGSMPRLGFIPCAEAFVAVLQNTLGAARLRGLVLTGGYQPLHAACLEAWHGADSVAHTAAAASQHDHQDVLMALPHAPHEQLLPRCMAIIHHGGAGTTGAALRCGIPQILLPFQFDQFTWAEKVVDMGLGGSLPGAAQLIRDACDQLSAQQLREALLPLLHRAQQPGLVAQCRNTAAALAHEPNGAAEAVAHILRHLEAPAAQLRSHKSSVAADEEQPRAKRLCLHHQPWPTADHGNQPERKAAQDNGRAADIRFLLSSAPHAVGSQCSAADEVPPVPQSQLFDPLPVQRIWLSQQLEALTSCPSEAQHLHDEIFVRRSYLQHGIGGIEGGTVIDVGANIGMFVMFLLKGLPAQEQPSRIIAVEPLPPNRQLLVRNIQLHGLEDRVTVVPLAADAVSNRTMRCTYYPNMPGNSTAQPAEKAQLQAGLMPPHRFAGQTLHDVQTVTISDLVRTHQLQQVDLLKVDVEGCELRVLQGIQQEHWPRVRQVVLEAHDVADGGSSRICSVQELLQSQGFEFEVHQGELAHNTMVYAKKL